MQRANLLLFERTESMELLLDVFGLLLPHGGDDRLELDGVGGSPTDPSSITEHMAGFLESIQHFLRENVFVALSFRQAEGADSGRSVEDPSTGQADPISKIGDQRSQRRLTLMAVGSSLEQLYERS